MKNKKSVKCFLASVMLLASLPMLAACGSGTVQKTESSQSSVSATEESSQKSNEASNEEESQKTSSQTVSEVSEEPIAFVPEEWNDEGIFSEYYEEAYMLMKSMSLDKQIGQMIFAGSPGDNAVELAKEYYLGGYVLFASDFKGKNADEVSDMLKQYKESTKIPLAIAVDEEGGTVVRVSGNELLSEKPFASPREIYESGGMEALKTTEQEKAILLKKLGIDINLAPVCDIAVNEDEFMYDRSLGQSTDITSQFVAQTVKIYQENGISATLKHFPGYGGNVDTHTGTAVDNREYSVFEETDFKPFEAGIAEKASFVMVSHNIVNCMDEKNPSSLSAEVHRILREEMNFTGLIITDDLSMGAVTEYSGEYDAFVTAVLAGNDIITTGSPAEAIESIRTAVENGVIPAEKIEHAVMRILAWKLQVGLL